MSYNFREKGVVTLPNRLKALRLEKGLTTRELAEKYGVSHASISRAETGERNLNEQDIEFFTTFFGVTSDYLLGLSDERTNKQKIVDISNSGVTEIQFEFIKKIEELDVKDIEQVMDYIDFLKSKEKK